MKSLPSIERITGLGLLTAALTILVLAVLVVYDVQRETELNREVIGAQHLKDVLESLRTGMHELRYAARIRSFTGSREAAQAIERRAVEIEADLAYLEARAGEDATITLSIAELTGRVKAFVVHARALGLNAPEPRAAIDADAEEMPAWEAVERLLEVQSTRITERSSAQIRVGENLKSYVTLLLVGSICVLAGLFSVFLHAQSRARAAQRRIEHLAHFDAVTNLPNRTLLSDRLAQEAVRARRGELGFALAMFDLDGFKGVNDSYGHAAGDALLAEVGRRCRENVRASDTVGRLGGDEFLAILPETSREGALQVAEKLRAALCRPYVLGEHQVTISASVGLSLYPEHGTDVDALLRAADAALYEAKRAGKNLARFAADRGA